MTVLAPPRPATIALVGVPNTGKSTLFNRLTGLRQQVGNYPGVTVERRQGVLLMPEGGERATLVDLPGCYTLRARSLDEQIAADFLAGRLKKEPPPDLIVCVINACDLARQLFLPLQLAELRRPLVLALNFIDEARARGIQIDSAALGEKLGVRAAAVSARDGTGIETLVTAIGDALRDPVRPRLPDWPPGVLAGLRELEERLSPGPRCRGDLLRLLFGGPAGEDERSAVQAGQAELVRQGLAPGPAEAFHLHKLAQELAGEVVQKPEQTSPATWHPDRVLTHRIGGPVFFALLMTLVFQAVYAGAVPLMEAIEGIQEKAQTALGGILSPWPLLQSLMCDGVIAGVGAFLVFLPQILILFLFISLLEETGYMARAAFLMDRLFAWSGLSGKSFVPLLSCYACAVPGILATRTIEDARSRLGTILIAPLMSCSARLPVYVLLIGAFIAPVYGPWVAGLALLLAHLLGLVLALPIGWVLNRWLLGTRAQPFVLEMPPYRFPHWKNVGCRVWESGREFVVKAGTIILAVTIVIWALLSFPREALESPASGSAEQLAAPAIENSWLGQLGRQLEPVFEPAGFDWRVTVGILASFSAREVIIPTLSVLYQLDHDADETSSGLRAAMREHRWEDGPRVGERVFTLPAVLALIVFFALCSQCAPTLAVITRESGFRWAVFTFVYLTLLAWAGAVATFQAGTWLTRIL